MSNDIYNEVWLRSEDKESIEQLSEIVELMLPDQVARKQCVETVSGKDSKQNIEMFAFWTRRSPFPLTAIELLVEKFSDVEFRSASTDQYDYHAAGTIWIIEHAMNQFDVAIEG